MKSPAEIFTFERCVLICWQHSDFMREYRRLSGHRLGEPAQGIDGMIDQACGRPGVLDPKEARAFFAFVRDYVWIPVLQKMHRP